MKANIIVRKVEDGTEIDFKSIPKYAETIYLLKTLGLEEKYADKIETLIYGLTDDFPPKAKITDKAVVIWRGTKHTAYVDRDVKDKSELGIAIKEYIQVLSIAEVSHFEFNRPRTSYVEFISKGIHFIYDILPERKIVADIGDKKVQIELHKCSSQNLEKVAELIKEFGVVDKIVFDKGFEGNTLIDNNGELILLARSE